MDEHEILTKVIENEQRSKSNAHRIDEVEKRIKDVEGEQKVIYELATSVGVIAQRVTSIEDKVDETNRKFDEQAKTIREVESRPYKRTSDNVNSIRVAIITAICSLLVSGAVSCLINMLSNK